MATVSWRTRFPRGLKPAVFLLACTPFAYLVWAVFANALGANPAEALIRSAGDWALRFLCLVLLVTPLRQWTGVSALLSLRRMLGLFVYFYVLVHLLSYAWLDMSWLFGDIVLDVIKRPFIAVGMVAFALLTALAITSPHVVVRRLGARRWKRLHQAVYVVACLAVLHFFWMRSGKQDFAEVWVYGGILAVLLGVRLRTFIKRPRPAK